MKKLALIACFILITMLMHAASLDDVIYNVLSNGKTIEHEGDTVFMPNMYFSDQYTDKDTAFEFLAYTAYIFMVVQDDWGVLKNESYTSYINGIDEVAVPWTNDYQTFIMSITMDEIVDNFGEDYDMGELELRAEIRSYIEYYADHSPASMY